MDSIAPNGTRPLHAARKVWLLGPLAKGVSQPPWSWRMAGWTTLVSFAGFLGLPFVFDRAAHPWLPVFDRFWPILLWAGPMFCSLVYLTRHAGTTVSQAFGFRGTSAFPVLASSLLLFVVQTLVLAGTMIVFTWLGLETGPRPGREAGTLAKPLFFSITHLTVWVPLCEELWFRGLLYTSLRTRLGVAASSLVTAALFAAVHSPGHLTGVAMYLFPGVLFSIWYERTRSLWPDVIAHSLHNAVFMLAAHANA